MSRVLADHRVPDLGAPIRLDAYAAETFAVLPSRSAARKAARRGEILVDGAPGDSARFVREGQRIVLLEPDRPPPKPWDHPLDLPHVDEHLAVVVKPPGVPTNGNRWRTVEHALVAALPPPDRPEALRWARPVHRLDTRTGGLLLVARTGPAQVTLGRALQERRVEKRYRALVVGRLEGEGRVETPIEGREAVSDWRVVDQTRSLKTGWVSTVDCWPRTGRTHQLRLHLAGLGHPVLGDDLHGQGHPVLRGAGLFLWSLEVRLEHPVTGAPLEVQIPEPSKYAARRRGEDRRWHRHQERQRQGSKLTP